MSDHLMIGPGGRAKIPRSESRELESAIGIVDGLRSESVNARVKQELSRLEKILQRLHSQSSEGYHRNPGVYAPFRVVGVIGRDVHFIAYQHDKDKKNYKHDFKGGNAEVLAVERHGKRELLITSPTGANLWDEF